MSKLLLATMVVLLFVTGSAFADCPTAPTGPYAGSFGWGWYVYSQDQECYSTSGSIWSSTVNCSYFPGWQFGANYSSYAVASFTAGNTLMSNEWEASSFVEFHGRSVYDYAEIYVNVTHNGTTTGNLVWSWDGTNGTLNGCAEQGGTFTAESGDQIEIQVYAMNYSGATIRMSTPRIFNVTHP